MIDEFDQNVHFVEIDIEEDPEVAEAANIMGTPCVQFFKNKEMIRFVDLFSIHLQNYGPFVIVQIICVICEFQKEIFINFFNLTKLQYHYLIVKLARLTH